MRSHLWKGKTNKQKPSKLIEPFNYIFPPIIKNHQGNVNPFVAIVTVESAATFEMAIAKELSLVV